MADEIDNVGNAKMMHLLPVLCSKRTTQEEPRSDGPTDVSATVTHSVFIRCHHQIVVGIRHIYLFCQKVCIRRRALLWRRRLGVGLLGWRRLVAWRSLSRAVLLRPRTELLRTRTHRPPWVPWLFRVGVTRARQAISVTPTALCLCGQRGLPHSNVK